MKARLGLITLLVCVDQFLKASANWLQIERYNSRFIVGFVESSLVLEIALIATLITILILIIKLSDYFKVLGLILIFSGGVSNLIDRIRVRSVIDFIDFFDIWYINFADIYIFIGVLIVVVSLVAYEKRAESKKRI